MMREGIEISLAELINNRKHSFNWESNNEEQFQLKSCSSLLSRVSDINGHLDLRRMDEEIKKIKEAKNNIFMKKDKEKTNLAILLDTSKAIEEIAKVMEYGANKYSRENWRNVDDKERYIAATLRHIFEYKNKKLDDESGLNHLAHAACSLIFLLELENENERD